MVFLWALFFLFSRRPLAGEFSLETLPSNGPSSGWRKSYIFFMIRMPQPTLPLKSFFPSFSEAAFFLCSYAFWTKGRPDSDILSGEFDFHEAGRPLFTFGQMGSSSSSPFS